MVIYTKRGDKGKTSLLDKANAQKVRVTKASLVVESLGAIDELNSYIGVCRANCENPKTNYLLRDIQGNLLTIGTIVAGSNLRFSSLGAKRLEKVIDNLEGTLPVLKNFVYPGGTVLSAHLQYARSLARRAERRIVALSQEKKIKPSVLSYLNRLSDFLFMLAREANNNAGVGDDVWNKRR